MGRTPGAKNKLKDEATTTGGKGSGKDEVVTPEILDNGPGAKQNTTVEFGFPKNDSKENINLFDETIAEVRNPLDNPVVEKSYTAIDDKSKSATNSSANKTDGSGQPPKEFQESSGSSTTTPEKPKLTDEQIKSQAEQTAQLFWRFYEKIHGLLRYWGKVDENELLNEHLSGVIDLNQELPIGQDKVITLREFIAQVNASIGTQIVVTEELKEALTPAIVRVCIKRGWLIGDETYIAWTLLEDMATKLGVLFGIKKSQSQILDACRQILLNQKELADAGKKKEGTSASDKVKSETTTHEHKDGSEKDVVEWATETKNDGSTSKIEVQTVGE